MKINQGRSQSILETGIPVSAPNECAWKFHESEEYKSVAVLKLYIYVFDTF